MTKVLFIVQGEGRGHLTQAIALSEMLGDQGCQITVAVGSDPDKPLPAFFQKHFEGDLFLFVSPSLAYVDGEMDVSRTFLRILKNVKAYGRSVSYLNKLVQKIEPDVIVNFYEPLGGLYAMFYRKRAPVICIAHQYLLFHQDFQLPPHRDIDRWLMMLNNRITAFGAFRVLALSFRRMSPFGNTLYTVVPPLRRQQVKSLVSEDHRFVLVYLTHHDLSYRLVSWHHQRPEVKIRCFWDHPTLKAEFVYDDSLVFFPVDATHFLEQMRKCSTVVTTAGFESVAEAMYIGKPILLVPVPGHFEQACNAIDAAQSHAAVQNEFDLSGVEELMHVQTNDRDFREWVDGGFEVFWETIQNALLFSGNR